MAQVGVSAYYPYHPECFDGSFFCKATSLIKLII